MNKLLDGTKLNEGVSSVMLTSLLFVAHTLTNAYFLSPLGGDFRCLFWDKASCTEDEGWIASWFSFSHFHIAMLLSGVAYVVKGTPKLEATLSYVVAGIIVVYLAEGITSFDSLNIYLANVQLIFFVLLLIGIAFSTAEQERLQPLLPIPLPKRLTSTSFDRRNKVSVATIATGFQLISSMYRIIDMVLEGPNTGYKGDPYSSLIYPTISSMCLCDMMIVAILFGISLRFLDPAQQKVVLWCEVASLFVTQAMLAGEVGDKIEQDMKEAGVIATFVCLVVATIGAL